MSVPVARVDADLRLLRAAMFTAVCLALSATGHQLASGASVPVWVLGVGFGAVFAVAAPLAGRERRLSGIAAGLVLGQSALHTIFGLAQRGASAASRSSATPPVAGGHSGSRSDNSLIALASQLVCNDVPGRMTAAEARRIVETAGIHPDGPGHAGATVAAGGHHSAFSSLLPSLPMLLGHLLAALALGLLLRHGEAALFRLVQLSVREVAEAALVRSLRAALALVRLLRAGLPAAPARGLPASGAEGQRKPGLQSAALEHSVTRRGPPAPYALAV